MKYDLNGGMMRKKKKRVLKKNMKRMLVFGMSSLAIVTFVFVSIANIVGEILDKYKEANELENQKIVLEEREKKLNDEILKLQDSEYLARYAREKYFYSKDGELIIRITNEEN